MAQQFVTNDSFFGQNGEHTPGKWCIGAVAWCGAIPVSPDFNTEEEVREYASKNNIELNN